MSNARFQFSLRSLLGLFIVFALCLALVGAEYYYTIGVVIVYFFVVGCLGRSPAEKRTMVWGPLAGIFLFMAVGLSVSKLRGEYCTYTMWETAPCAWATGRMAVPVGGFLGGVMGLFVAAVLTSRSDDESNEQEIRDDDA